MDDKIASFHLEVRRFDESHQEEVNFNTIDNPAMNTIPYPHSDAIKEPCDNKLFQAEMNPGGECILKHLISQINYQPLDVAGGTYRALMEDFIKKLESTDNACEVTTIKFHDDSSDKVKNFIDCFNRHMESQITQSVPTSFYSLKVSYIKVTDAQEARVVRDCMSKNSKAGIKINKYSDVILPAKISFTFNNKHFDIIFPWIPTPEGFLLSIKGCTPDIYKVLFSKLKGLAIALEYSKILESLNEFMKDNYLFVNKNSGIALKGVDLSVLLTMVGVANVPYNLNAFGFHFLGVYNTEMFVNSDDSDDNEILSMSLQHSGMILWKVSVLCQILFTMLIAPTPGMAIILTKKSPTSFLNWISLLITDILDCAELPVRADYVTCPRKLLSLLYYTKDKYWNSEKVLSLLPKWRSLTGGGSLSDRQCLEFLIGNVPLLTSKSLHKSLRIADPGDIGKGLGYNFNEPAVLFPDFYHKTGIQFDPMCNTLPNGDALEDECVKHTVNGQEELILKDVMPQLKQNMFEFELIEGTSPSDVFLMLCWRHLSLVGFFMELYGQNMDPIDFYRGSGFAYAVGKMVANHLKPSQVSNWEKQNLESVRVFSIIKNQKLLKNDSVSASVKSRALVNLKKVCKKLEIPVDQATKFVWKKLKEYDSKRSADASKAEDDLTIDMELDLCGFTDEGHMIIATESAVDDDSAAVDVGSAAVDGDSAAVDVGSAAVDVGSAAVDAGSAAVDVGSAAVDVGSANDGSNEEILDFYAADPIDDPLLIYD